MLPHLFTSVVQEAGPPDVGPGEAALGPPPDDHLPLADLLLGAQVPQGGGHHHLQGRLIHSIPSTVLQACAEIRSLSGVVRGSAIVESTILLFCTYNKEDFLSQVD